MIPAAAAVPVRQPREIPAIPTTPECTTAASVRDRFAGVPCPPLRAAAERVAASWANDRGESLNATETTDVLGTLVQAICQRRSGTVAAVDSRAASPLGRRLLDLVRAELIRDWHADGRAPESAVMRELLGAIEAVRQAIEPNWAQYFSARLSGPDAQELLVEVAHDLRSPLTSILFLAETLQRGQSGGVSDLQHRQLGLIYSAALGLSSVASDLIELVRGGDRLVEKDPAPLSITEIFESVRSMVHPIAEEKRLAIRLLPPTSDHRLGHPLALSRVLLNLTTNALKFTEEGFVELVAQATGPTHVEFSVRDTGDGINPDALESLYQPFRRTARQSGYYFSGTGLGLVICRKLVEAMGSELQVETRASWGTRFFFRLNLPLTRRA